MIFSKENTKQVKGAAIFCMIAFHLFGFPERVPSNIDHSWFGCPITKALQICVPIYLFMAGYGLQSIAAKGIVTWIGIARRLRKLYASYWWIISPFVVLGLLIGYYSFDVKEILCNYIGLTSSYNGEWWFFSLYVELLMLFYFISRIRLEWKRYLVLMITILFITRGAIKFLHWNECIIYQRHLKMILVDLNIFMLGCFYSKFDIFGRLYNKYAFLFDNYMVAPLLLVFPLLVRAYVPMIGITELFVVPIFIIGVVNVCKLRGGGKFFSFLGRHSMNLWLIHSFFIYYYLNSITFLINIPIIMLIIVLACSLMCSIGIDGIRNNMLFCIHRHDHKYIENKR